MSRGSYRGLMSLPAWWLYDQSCLVASVRAESVQVAHEIFKKHHLTGTHIIQGNR